MFYNWSNIPAGPIGVSVSGGADSALLLYFLMKNHKNKIHIFTLADKSKFYRNAKQCLHVVDWCRSNCNFNNFEHHIIHADEQTREGLTDLPTLYFKNKQIIKFYRGDTANPPREVTDSFGATHKQGLLETQRRDPTVIRDCEEGEAAVFPFTNINKKEIANLYRKENLHDLYELTISCESQNDIGPVHCDDCWWCEERKWGFGDYVKL